MQFSKIIDPNWPAPKKIKVYSITRNFLIILMKKIITLMPLNLI